MAMAAIPQGRLPAGATMEKMAGPRVDPENLLSLYPALSSLPAALFGQLMLEHAPFRDFVFHLFAERIGALMQLVEEVAFARLDQRLARLLLARNEGVLNITHQQLADELGSVREIVSRLLKGFAEQGLVSLGREQLTIVDRSRLQQIAAV
jgi:CRP/FNR family transcriptional regulator